MSTKTDSVYVEPDRIMKDWDVSRATAYNIIRKMNEKILKEHPTALIIAGKVNRKWYEESCLLTRKLVPTDE